MSIRFQCEQCGHAIDVDDHLAGQRGKCKHCGQPVTVPAHRAEPGDAPLRLRPIHGDEPSELADRLLAAPSPLKVRAAEADPRVVAEMISDPDDEPSPASRRVSANYSVLDPHAGGKVHSSSGPPPAWSLIPVRTARWVSGRLRTLRDWLYVASVLCLVVVLIGYLFQWKTVLHLGAVGVFASNISMLYVGVAYLVSLPFKESLRQGLANLLIPGYAIYYWWANWPRMKTAVYKTVGSFLPIALVGLAYFVYEEAPVVEAAVERRLPAFEKRLDRATSNLNAKAESTLAPLEQRVGVSPLEKKKREDATRRNRRPTPY